MFAIFCFISCENKNEKIIPKKKIDYIKPIPGKNDSIPVALAEKGEVLISYSDCYSCHKLNQRSVGPSFQDIATRYPVNDVYIEMLAQKVIMGGNGSWGYPVMEPHPKIPLKDAKMMVMYILSMKKDLK